MDQDRRLLASIDAAMAEAARRGGVVCRLGCTECCRGEFELTALDVARLRAGLARLAPEAKARVLGRVAAHTGGDDELCPVLDPSTGACELYEARPVTCRAFGAATRTTEGVAACEKCYAGWSDEAIAAQAAEVDQQGIEAALNAELEQRGHAGAASVAGALRAMETP